MESLIACFWRFWRPFWPDPLARMAEAGYARGVESGIEHWAGHPGGVVVWMEPGGRWRYVRSFRVPDGLGAAATEGGAIRGYLRTGHRQLRGK